jgi:glycerol-3-phosphate dehydrogenase
MGFPYGFVDFSTNQPTLQSSNIAEAGTLTMEWGRLSDYTFNTTYRKLAEGSVKKIISLVRLQHGRWDFVLSREPAAAAAQPSRPGHLSQHWHVREPVRGESSVSRVPKMRLACSLVMQTWGGGSDS